MQVSISYPPIPTDKGSPLLSQNRQFQYFNEATFIYPVIPAYAATILKQNDHDTIWDDAISEQKNYDSWLRGIERNAPDMICLETKTPTIKWHWKVISDIKRISPETKTLLYGDHVTALPMESFRNSKVDYIIRGGDYDRTIASLANYLDGKGTPDGGVWYRDNDSVKNTGDFTQKKDMGDLPFIDRDLTKWELYSVHNGNYKVTPGTYTMAGRDCWYRNDGGCTFCSWTTHYPQFTVRKPDNLLDEVGHLINNYGIREIFDDTGTFPIGGWLEKFCDGMVERKYNESLYMGCNMRFGALTMDQYRMMKKANFRFMLFGVESHNQKTIDMLNKGVTSEEQIKSCVNAAKAGLDPHLTIMFGYPWETKKDAMKTVEACKWLIKKGYAKTWQVTIVIPYPGTVLFDMAKMNGWLRTEDWERYDMREPILEAGMKESEVLQIVQNLYKVALDPEFILRKVVMIRSIDDIKFMVRGAGNIFGHIKDFAPEQLKQTLTKEEPITQ
ncbi:trans-aconitate 2-methyltransferase protein [Marine Group I thaumarchaeote SCGC AAA799-B03]|uniref:Trans-aconitate 2-methyltransferase protein n=1 Tax=Marine Group I thaumarchaeote SCGC AAA799-B03 TaxID=1502289 RepID=A0A087S904_9ARCH|nr:trans-aconitate 2-methyltransferase protein [Marine Group I thaumarchaeote SCGC AAA799-B03]